MKILSTAFNRSFAAWTLPDWAVDELRRKFPQFEIVALQSPERILAEIADADILLAPVVKDSHIRAAARLRWIHSPMSGLEGLLIPAVVDSDIVVSNSRGVHAIPIAEHAMALMLAFSRKLPQCLDDQRQLVCRRKDRLEESIPFNELHGKTIGVVGLGGIGIEIARRAHAFGMRVVGFRRQSELRPDCVESIYSPAAMDDVLPSLDFVVMAVPLTPDTRGMMGAAQFERMKPSSFFINVARGEIVDQEALTSALEAGQIAGAGLDVTVPDPLPDGHPLYSVRNLLITPHTAGVSPMLWRREMDLWIENIQRYLDGRELVNQVMDKRKGY